MSGDTIYLYHGCRGPLTWEPNYEKGIQREEYNLKRFGKPLRLDYGTGFYLGTDVELAKEWAAYNFDEDNEVYVRKYKLDITDIIDLEVCDLTERDDETLATLIKHSESYIAEQAAKDKLTDNKTIVEIERKAEVFLNKNTTNLGFLESADIIIGPRMDSKYNSFILDYFRYDLDLETFSQLLKLGNLDEQVFLKSKKAYQALKHIDDIKLSKKEIAIYYDKYIRRVESSKAKYNEIIGRYMNANK